MEERMLCAECMAYINYYKKLIYSEATKVSAQCVQINNSKISKNKPIKTV